MLVAGDAAGMTLSAGIWLEGVNFAIGSGLAAGRAAAGAIATGDVSRRALQSYRRELESQFVLADHRRLRKVPKLLDSERVQRRYPAVACDLAEGLFTVTNPVPKPGLARLARRSLKRNGVSMRGAGADLLLGMRIFR
jgi:electron transfer flavoprotein-quinone oxidoreductase